MIVGFTITDFKGHEKEAVAYIQKVCVLESPEVAENIVANGPGVNIFSKGIDLSELLSQPFESVPIETQDGRYLLVSVVNFNLELIYNGEVLGLVPTEYMYVNPEDVSQFKEYVSQGLVRFIPDVFGDGDAWILDDNFWDDNGVWVDSDFWRD